MFGSRRRDYPRDPYWLNARFASVCSCGKAIKKGDRIFYYPNEKKAVCEDPCGLEGAAYLQADKAACGEY